MRGVCQIKVASEEKVLPGEEGFSHANAVAEAGASEVVLDQQARGVLVGFE